MEGADGAREGGELFTDILHSEYAANFQLQQKYEKLHEQDKQRYIQEYRSVYGEEPDLVKSATV